MTEKKNVAKVVSPMNKRPAGIKSNAISADSIMDDRGDVKGNQEAVMATLTKEEIDALSDDEYDSLSHEDFMAAQVILLEAEKSVYLTQAEMFKEEAATLARESEPGDVQFDEESGEGGNSTMERERDLALLASHMATVSEIDEAIEKIAKAAYGKCANCHSEIPRIRLRALPYARLCVHCKSGSIIRR
ncbi:TraR/DksA family transcriptional regulator [Acidithrix ferrooxidans]|uniref:RNA polymerase-binding transcription factor DksA n=1 Tax=Acidithrix ferrooxidans TaxID=1280514 RepID=A0A0D8HMI6_9ACTN|nr:TraR/DksA family transcriptional regulator [Acidithrix ferrooxidans]KJF19064.1 RNA polymerase-binding transcription factor DksA [Acidithrix ferrooxidans]